MKKIPMMLTGCAMLAMSSMTFANSEGEMITYEVNGTEYEGYYISPAEDAPLVVVIHDWDGLTDYEVKRAGMLSDLGYAVFAADLYGAGVRPTETDDKKAQTSALYNDREKMRTLIQAAVDTAAEQGANVDNAVTMGYCFGGAAALEYARSGAPMKGFTSFHGGLNTPEGQSYADTQGTVLVLHGTADESVTMGDFAELATELEEAGIKHEMITYSGAPHAFTVFDTDRYREDADMKSWQRFVDYLAVNLKVN